MFKKNFPKKEDSLGRVNNWIRYQVIFADSFTNTLKLAWGDISAIDCLLPPQECYCMNY